MLLHRITKTDMQEDNQNVRYWPHSLAMCFKIGAGHFDSNIVLIAIFCCCWWWWWWRWYNQLLVNK